MDALEKNRNTLRQAFRAMPAHEPPEAVWQGIERDLGEAPLRQALERLPRYQPPEALWRQIETELDRPEPVRPARPRRLSAPQPLWVALAAAVTLALVSLWWLQSAPGADQPRVQIVYGEETGIAPGPLAEVARATQETAATEALLEAILAAYEQRPYLQGQVRYTRLRTELDELTQARASLQDAVDRYGQDGELYRQIGRIERDRSRIIKQLAAAI